jgi:hypothetical protein
MDRKQTLVVAALCLVFLLACSVPALATLAPQPIPTPAVTIPPTTATTLTPAPMPVMISSGTIDIPQTYMADLDAGIVPHESKNPAMADVDLWFDAASSTDRYLEPYNGASMMVLGTSAVGYNECKGMQAVVARVDINSLTRGTYICVLTNIRNISVVRVNSIDYSAPGTIRLDYMTWHQP